MVLSASTPGQSRTVLLEQIADQLAQDQNLIRIKKLLLCVCTGTWENDPHRLGRACLKVLLQHLFEEASTLEQLQQRLTQVVATLNKSTEYTIVANTVVNRLRAVYVEMPQSQSPAVSRLSYQAVVQRLVQEPEQLRIRKLLLLTCRSRWATNLRELEQLNMLDLVQELHQIAPTSKQLETTLNQVAKALSKPEEYAKIAERISTQLQSLYQQEATVLLPETTRVADVPQETISSNPAAAPQGQSIPTLLNLSSKVADRVADAAPVPPAASRTKRPTLKVLTVVQPQKIKDLFDLRLQILQDTNPLKTKILLFSLLHEPFHWQTHETMLKNHELDDLLRILFLSHKLYSDVASRLVQTAQLLGADEYLQAAEALLRAIQPFYRAAEPPSTVVPVLHATLTDITNMKSDTNEVTLPEHH